jgi:NAD(P)-dependent dehydrogenase (short-subunit alcohol dehydrogenase family)
MARIMITGSADGLGQMAARLLIGGGHEVVLHARNDQRASDALEGAPGAAGVITGDLAVIGEMAKVAQ